MIEHINGVVMLEALERAGVGWARLRNMPEYERLARGVYAMPGARKDFWFDASSAVIIAGEDAQLTAGSALFAHGILKKPPALMTLVVPEGKGSRKKRGVSVRRSSHLPEQSSVIARVRVVPVTYAITDYARDVPDKSVAFAISQASALRLASPGDVEAASTARGQFPGSARLRRVLEDFDDETTHSSRERKLRRALRRLGLVMHPEPMDIENSQGRTVGQADIAIEDVRLDVEVDGPHHGLPWQRERDRRRDRDLAALDWLVVRYSIYEIDEDVDRVAREILRLVVRRREARLSVA